MDKSHNYSDESTQKATKVLLSDAITGSKCRAWKTQVTVG